MNRDRFSLGLLATLLLASAPGPSIAQVESDGEPRASGSPTAVIVGAVQDIGRVEYGKTYVHEFEIVNEGDSVLELFDARSSCGCTVLSVDERIEPGESGRLRVRLDPGSQDGAFAVRVDVFTNDQENARLTMTLKAQLDTRVVARPGYIRYKTHRGSIAGRAITQILYATDGSPMRIEAVESPYPFVEVSFGLATPEELLEGVEEQQWTITTTLLPDAPAGPLNGTVVARLDHPIQKAIRIPLLGLVHDVFATEPDAFDFGRVEIGEGIEARVRIRSYGGDPASFSSVETSLPGTEVEISSVETGSSSAYFLSLRLKPDMQRGPFAGVVRVHTSSAEMPVIEVPVTGEAL
ncbi:MAG: DUF1573 domain-containing protein [Acidobacteria bacterium]|nr:DUF1573 domain-containing protein [Acidobacteriota bacterium]